MSELEPSPSFQPEKAKNRWPTAHRAIDTASLTPHADEMSQDLQTISSPEEIILFEKDNPRALVNLVPKTVAEEISNHLFTNPELFDKDEHLLKKWLKQEKSHEPSPMDHRLRMKFWIEYDRVQVASEKQMNFSNILAGVCSRELFYNRYLRDPLKAAWLLCPPTGYMVKAEEALEFSIDQLRDLLELPHSQTLGGVTKVNTQLAKLKVTIFEMLHTIVKGAPVQRTMNVHAHTANQKVIAAATANSMEELQKKLKELERMNRKAQNLPLESEAADVPDPT